MTEALTDTHRRARLRGRESIARWRIAGATWVGWLYAANAVLVVALGAYGIGSGVRDMNPVGIVGAVALSAGMIWGIHRMRQGSTGAGLAVTGVAAAFALLSWPPSLIDYATVAVLANGAYGAFQLEKIQREAAMVPPAPEPRARFGRALG